MTQTGIPRRVSLARELSALGLLGLALAFSFAQFALGADQGTLPAIDAAAQAHVAELIQEALGPYRPETDPSNSAAALQHLLSVEANFRAASALMPYRLDLRFGIASALILQATQTNSQFDLVMGTALKEYQSIAALDTNGFEARLYYAAFARAVGEQKAADETMRLMLLHHPARASEYAERFQRIDAILQMPLNFEVPRDLPTTRELAIVLLGAALDTNGMIKTKLVGRLQQTLKVAEAYPEAQLVVTGGNQKAGVTEAHEMCLWLLAHGLPAERIHLEDKARDTVGNAVYSAAILEKLGVTHVTLVTSANHVRRGLVALQEACLHRKLPLTYSTLAAPGEPEPDLCRERLGVYRDALRASGLWAFPGVQR